MKPNANSTLGLIVEAAAANLNRPAMVIDDREYSYGCLLGKAGAIAETLSEFARPGERCAVLGKRSPASYFAILGILGAGQVYVPLSQQDPPSRQAEKLYQADVRCLIVDAASVAQLQPILERMERPPVIIAPESTAAQLKGAGVAHDVRMVTCTDIPAEGDYMRAIRPRSAQDPAYLLFTSGSTGAPKGVLVPLSAVADYLIAMRDLLELQPDDRCSQWFDPSFDLAIHDVLVCWSAGAALVPQFSSTLGLVDEIRSKRITAWFSIPSCIAVVEKIGQLKPDSLPSLRVSLFCGEALLAQDARAWQRAASNSRILNLYGPTEATIAVSAFDATSGTDRDPVVAIGKPFGRNEFHLLDPSTGAVTDDDEGELAIGGSQLALNYWRDPALTEARFPMIAGRDGLPVRVYRTGDRAKRAHGNYWFLGRLDNEIKINGYRINPLEVEAVLAKVAEPTLSAVVVRRSGQLSPIDLVGFLSRSDAQVDEILEKCKRLLPNYMWPVQILTIDEFPRLPNGKIDRHKLAEMARQT